MDVSCRSRVCGVQVAQLKAGIGGVHDEDGRLAPQYGNTDDYDGGAACGVASLFGADDDF